MAKLDRSRPFGQIYGLHEDGAVYEQDGKLFLGNDDEVPKKGAKQKPVVITEAPQESPSSDAPEAEAVQAETGLSGDEAQAPAVSEETPKNKGGRPRKTPETESESHDDLV